MIVGLVSTYMEGQLAADAVASCRPACDLVGVFEGKIGDAPDSGNAPDSGTPSVWSPGKNTVYAPTGGVWGSDALKRTYMLEWAKGRHATGKQRTEPLWVLWVDGDEVLMWGEYLRAMVAHAEASTGAGGFGLRIQELDGSCAMTRNRIQRADMVQRYLVGASQVELTNGMVVVLPNEPLCGAGGIPVGFGVDMPTDPAEQADLLAYRRPPLQGEPHLLHRSILRDPARAAERQHLPEARSFDVGAGGP